MSWEWISDTIHKARKNHICYLCGQLIEKGTTYLRRKGADDGEFGNMTMHIECEKHTHDCDEFDWDLHDEYEFRREYLEESEDK